MRNEFRAVARTACACLAWAGIAWVSLGSGSTGGSPGDTEAQPSDGQLWQIMKRRWWQELPDTPAAPTVESASTESLLVTWEAPDSTTDIAAYHVEFRVHDASESTVRELAGNETGTTITIDGLMSSTLYHVRVRAVNDAGPGDWSVPGIGMTENAAPVFLEGDAAMRTLPENSPGAYEIGAPVAATDADSDTLSYRLGGADAQAFSIDASTGQLVTRSDYSYDHEANPSHELAVTAADGQGNQAEIALTVHVADVLEPPLQPDPPAVAPTDIDTLTVSWTAPPNAGRPDITGYSLRYRGSRGRFTLWPEIPTRTRAEITGLQADSYEVQVRGINDEGDGAWSASGHGTIVANRPPNLVVNRFTVNDANPDPGERFTLSATVTNAGEGDSPATTLRYYRSTNDTISRSDTQVGTDAVSALSAAGTSAESLSLSAPTGRGTYYYGACVDAVADESDTFDNCSSSVRVDVEGSTAPGPGFDIDIVFVDPQPSAAIRGAVNAAAAVWERAITSDLADVDFSSSPRNNACTDREFAGFVDDLRVYVYVVDIDGPGGTTASAGHCTERTATGTPVIGRIRLDSNDVNRLGTTLAKHLAVHELAHVLGFGNRWTVQNPSIHGGQPVDPPPDTHWPGANAVAAFNAAGGTNYQGGKVPVENEHAGTGSQDRHWRLSAMPGEVMTYNLHGTALSAITIQAMADLGYTVNAGVADSYSISSTVGRAPPLTAAREFLFRCEIDPLPVEYVPGASEASP